MKKFFVGALVAALCAVPAMSRAETQSARKVTAPAASDTQSRQAPADASESSEGEASDYAAREKAAPQQVGEFSGGAEGIYIGAGALVAALVIVLLIAAL